MTDKFHLKGINSSADNQAYHKCVDLCRDYAELVCITGILFVSTAFAKLYIMPLVMPYIKVQTVGEITRDEQLTRKFTPERQPECVITQVSGLLLQAYYCYYYSYYY